MIRDLRILHLLSSSAFHGAESMTVELVRQQARLGAHCHLAVFDNRGRGDREALHRLRDTCEGTTIIQSDRAFSFTAAGQLRDYVRRQRIDLCHSHKYKTTIHALVATFRTRVPLVATYHNWVGDDRRDRAYHFVDQRAARFVDAAVAVSQPVADILRQHAVASRVTVIGNGVDTQRFANCPDRSAARRALGLQDLPTLGFVGRLTPEKGLSDLLAALAPLAAITAFQVLVVGGGDYRVPLETQIQDRGLRDRVHLLGARNDTPQLYAAMDLFVLPSYVEAFPMVLLECLASGVPAIATNIGDISMLIRPNETGWLIRPGQISELSDTIATALGDPVRLRKYGAAGQSLVENNFSAATMTMKYAEVYRRVLPR